MKRIVSAVSILLVLVLAFTSLAEVTYSDDGSFPICSEPVKLTVGIQDDALVEDYETNDLTMKLLEWGNFDLDFVTYASTDYMTKLNTMVMAGGDDLPDVLFIPTGYENMIYSWALEGAIIPVTEYINDPTVSFYYHDAMARTGVNMTSQIVSPDGEVYGLPTYNQSYANEVPDKAFYYAPWLEKLGLDVPTTTDELYDVFEAICTGDPNGNGIADEVAISGIWGKPDFGVTWFPWLMNSFVYAGDLNYYLVNDGEISAAYVTDEWREGLKFMRSLFEAGFIPMETLTQDSTAYNALLQSKCVFMQNQSNPAPYSTDPEFATGYKAFAPMIGPEGVQLGTNRISTASVSFVITKNCKNPEAAFRMGDLLLSQTLSITARFGQQGVNWDYLEDTDDPSYYVPTIEGWDVIFVAYDDPSYWNGGKAQNAAYRQHGPYVRQYKISMSGKKPEAITPYVRNYAECYVLYQESDWKCKDIVPKLVYSAEESDLISEKKVALMDYVVSATASFLAGNTDINDDNAWNAFVEECYNIGLETILEVENEVYTRMYK